ncbi:DUF3967 domain-containing protein [Ectobacillus sp. SYSU M60031]|uniref:DUF3967 domain-containing protein n=2 Tax=Ectobacillus ponti TaxID=2961894 RepID=A0AA41XDG4_9BACI|nr:DUF3967 domain-containing protein [Ectobacillus ponti]MCP8970868.1 DUF3967 domain-containing protein [Ectobacillus ponti]
MTGTFKTKDVTNKTGIPRNLVRTYSQTLEQHGYSISRMGTDRVFKLEDLRLLKAIHERVQSLHEDVTEVVQYLLQEQQPKENKPVQQLQAAEAPAPLRAVAPAAVVASIAPPALQEDVTVTIREQSKRFEEFMSKLDNLAQLNEAIIHQNSTLISQNRQKDEKLDELMHHVYVKESKQTDMLQDVLTTVNKTDQKQDEKLNQVMSQISKKDAKQEEKLGKLLQHMHNQDVKQDEKMGKIINQVCSQEAKQDERMNNLINHVYTKESSRDEQLMRLVREIQETKRMVAAAQEGGLLKTLRGMFGRTKPSKADSHS